MQAIHLWKGRDAAFWFIVLCWTYRVWDGLKLRGVIPMTEAERRQLEREERWNGWYAQRDLHELEQAWASIRAGMEKPPIRALLGEPHQIHTLRDSSRWKYERDGAVGRIDFDREGRVVNVRPPT